MVASSDDCRARLAVKLAGSLGEQVGERIQEFVKKRSMYGAQYVIRLTGNNLSLMTRTAFSRALKTVPGLEGASQRQAAAGQLEIVATYKGSDPLDQAVATALGGNPQFANLDSAVDGNVITLCMDGCSKQGTLTNMRIKLIYSRCRRSPGACGGSTFGASPVGLYVVPGIFFDDAPAAGGTSPSAGSSKIDPVFRSALDIGATVSLLQQDAQAHFRRSCRISTVETVGARLRFRFRLLARPTTKYQSRTALRTSICRSRLACISATQ